MDKKGLENLETTIGMSSSFVVEKEKGYIIKIDEEFFGIANSLDQATKILNSLADEEESRLSKSGRTVYRKTHPLEIQLHTFQKGIFGKTLQKEIGVSITEISRLDTPSIYADKIAQYKARKDATQLFVAKITSPTLHSGSNFVI